MSDQGGVQLVGLWEAATKAFPSLRREIPRAISAGILTEANDLRKRIVEQFRAQAPVRGTWKPLSPFTLAARRMNGFNGTKILIRDGDLRNSIQVQAVDAMAVFVGVNRTARRKGSSQRTSKGAGKIRVRKDGKPDRRFKKKASGGGSAPSLVNIGSLHEFGGDIVITVTQRMINYFFAMLKRTGLGHGGGGGGGNFRVGAKLKITIPPRPFIRPAVEYYTPSQYQSRIQATVMARLARKVDAIAKAGATKASKAAAK